MNYYRRYSGDYLRDTSDLTLMEHGAYDLLLDYYYTSETPAPADKQVIYRRLRAMSQEEQRAVDSVLARYFWLEDDGYHQKRVDHEIEVSKKARANGVNGGRPKTVTEYITEKETEHETGILTGCVTGLVHPPTTNHHPPASSLQPGKKARKRATSLPDNFAISSRVKAWAQTKGYHNLDAYLEFFSGRMRASGKAYIDWDQALMNCIREDWPKLRNGKAAGGDAEYFAQFEGAI